MQSTQFTPVAFLREVWVELQKVKWPSRNEAVKLTLIVIGVSLAVSIFIGIFDLVFTNFVQLILR